MAKIRNVQVISALSSFTPALYPQKLNLTAQITNIPTRNITGINVQAYQAGVNGVYTSASEGSVVAGENYTLIVTSNILDNGEPRVSKFHYTAPDTSLANLINSFVSQVNAVNQLGFTATNSSTHLRLTEAPLTGQTTGEVTLSTFTIKIRSTGLALEGSWTTTTAHVTPIGSKTQVDRLLAGTGYNTGGSTTTTAHTYGTVTVFWTAGQETMIDYLFFDEDALTTPEEDYIKTCMNEYAGQLGMSSGGARLKLTSTATSPSGTALIPLGTKAAEIVSSSNANFVGFATTMPVGTKVHIVADSTSAKLQMLTGETLNGGTATGSVLLIVSQDHFLEKISTTAWVDGNVEVSSLTKGFTGQTAQGGSA